MKRTEIVEFEFVDSIPAALENSKVYISIRYRTTAHLCMCGCGEKVVHPLRPTRWALTYDGSTISLAPSIGNIGLACKSHYWIRRNKVDWYPELTPAQLKRALVRDGWTGAEVQRVPAEEAVPTVAARPWWRRARVVRWWSKGRHRRP